MKQPIQGGTSFDQETLEEILGFMDKVKGESLPDVEDQILQVANDDLISNDEDADLELCWRLVHHNPELIKLMERIAAKRIKLAKMDFEDAESDPNDRLRIEWKVTERINKDYILNFKSAATAWESKLKAQAETD